LAGAALEEPVVIRDLATHSAHYVTVGELAEYWSVSRRQIYKHIESGALDAIRLGPRLYRIRAVAAAAFERAQGVSGAAGDSTVNVAQRPMPHRFGRPLRARMP
jgi:excisionase family DNA binding protein